MRSGTSFFNGTLYRKTLTRFWPLWTINLVLWLLILPFNGLMALAHDLTIERETSSLFSLFSFARSVGDTAMELGFIFAIVLGLAVAMAVCSHLYNNRSANFVAALPVRREGQFISTYLAGLTMLLAPNVIVFLLTLLVEAAGGAVVWSSLLFWLAAMCGMEFFFYSFAVCLGQFAGHILALPAYYAIFNFLVLAVATMLQWIFQSFYFGYDSGLVDNRLVYWCTPSIRFLQMDYDMMQENGVWITRILGLWVVAVYAVAALVLVVCALLLYRRRHMETAGDIVAVKAMRPVFKYSVAVCAGMFLGVVMAELFGFGNIGLMISVLIWAVVGYFVAQMLLDKTIRVFRKWKGAAAVVVVFLALFAVIGFDLTGFESRIPAADEVESVSVVGLDTYPNDTGAFLTVTLTDPEVIADVVALHEAIVEEGEDGEDSGDPLNHSHAVFQVIYTLKSGKILNRNYTVPVGPKLTALIQTIHDHDEVRYKTYELDYLEKLLAEKGAPNRLTAYAFDYVDVSDLRDANFVGADAQRLWDAVMADFEAGRIGVHSVTDYENYYAQDENGNYIYDVANSGLVFEWTWSGGEYGTTFEIEIALLEQSSETWEVLEELTAADNRYQDDPTDNPLARE